MFPTTVENLRDFWMINSTRVPRFAKLPHVLNQLHYFLEGSNFGITHKNSSIETLKYHNLMLRL